MKLLRNIFGKFSWETPFWMNHLSHQSRQFWGGILIAILVVIGTLTAWYWYQSRPQPDRVTAKITAPKITPLDNIVDKKLVPDVLLIQFGQFINGEFNSRSVAPLDLVGQEVKEGIRITPAIPGKWMWQSDSDLVFTPDQDWPANQHYKVHFDKSFFAENTKMADYQYAFDTLPLTATINEFKFYQDPLQAAEHYAVATMEFSFPVDEASLKDNIDLRWQGGSKIPFTLTFDEYKRKAFLHSETISLPKSERFMEVTLAKGVKSSTQSGKLSEKISATTLIPDASSFLRISQTNSTIVRNQQDRPEQILTLETTLGVKEPELAKYLHVYLLPKDYPATSAETAKINYQWQDPGEITDAILALSAPVNLQAIPADRDYATLHSYKYHALTPSYLYVKIDKGMTGFGNFSLSRPFGIIIKVPDYPQEISFLHKGALLALGTEEKLSVLIRGLSAVKFNIARVRGSDVNHLITQTGGDFSNPWFINSSFNQDNISEITAEIQSFDATDPGKEQYTALDLGKYLAAKSNNGGPLGLFLLRAQGYDTEKKTPLSIETNRLILITNLGLIVKDNADGTHDVFVQSIIDGIPVTNADISILGKNGVAIFNRKTDANGRASFPSLKDFVNEREPVVYLAANGNDVSFIPYSRHDRQLNYSRFDIGGVTSNANADNQAALTAYLFSDRGIYRPGDTVHLGMIVKQPYAMPAPAGIPLEASIVDPRGSTIKNIRLVLDATGYLTLDLPTTDTSPTGQYQIYLNIVKDNHASSMIGSTTIQVAEFLPDRMKISAKFSKEKTRGWLTPADLSVKAGLWNLYGAPAIDHRMSGKILLTPKTVKFAEFPDYIFIDPLLNPKSPPKVFTDNLPEVKTNDQGEATLDLKLDRFEKATYQLTVFVEGFEAEGGRSVTTQTSTLVSPLAYFVGYKPNGDLQYIKQGAPRNVHLIAVNPSLQQQALSDLTLKVFSEHPVTTLIKKEDGTYQYQSIIQTTEISQNAFAIAAEGTNYTLPNNVIGDFLITISTKDGAELSRFKYSIVGQSAQPLPKNAELSVKLNQTEFNPDTDIEMQITAPYTGAGLITIERDKVYATQWFKTSTTASLQKIHLPADFKGNGYVNIAYVRDINSPEIFMSPLSFSVLPFSVNNRTHELKVDLSIPKLARPGDAFNIKYKTDKPGKIIVFAVDEGILQVSRFDTPNPFNFYFQKHALEVNTLQILDQILPKFIADRELSAVGGDEGERALRSNLNPFKRKTEAPVVYWSGILDTDSTERTLTYNIPDYFNGTLRVMAVAVANDAVGSASQESEVRGHFVIQPNVPTFVAPQDEFEVTASIANNVEGSGKNANISIESFAGSQLEILGDARQTIAVPEGDARSIKIKVRAKSQLGSGEIRFAASLGDKKTIYVSTISIRPAIPYFTSLTTGYMTDSNKTLKLSRDLYPEYRKVDAAMSLNPVILMTGLQRYLDEYPYGCVEQLVSKAFAWLAISDNSVSEKIQKTIQMLNQRQMTNGGFNYWPDTGTSQGNDFASVYAMHFLTEAKVKGYNVPSEIFSSGIGYLRDLATRSVASLDEARIQAYAIYILTRNEIVTSNYLTHLQLSLDQSKEMAWKTDITSAYIAATHQLLKSNAEAEKMIQYFKPDTRVSGETDFYNQYIANAQYLYLIAKHFPAELQKSGSQLVMSLVEALNSNTISTVLSGYTTLALSAYQQNEGTGDVVYSISEILSDNKEKTLSLATGSLKSASIDLNAKEVRFNNPAKQGVFYQLSQAGFDKDFPSSKSSNGIEVVREYRNANDKALGDVKLGDEIVVHLRARSTDNQYHYNVAIVDLLPGGFEVVREVMPSNDVDYVDVREDRAIFFGTINPDSKEIIYRIKATSMGTFIVPSSFAASMYDPKIKSVGVAGSMSVVKP